MKYLCCCCAAVFLIVQPAGVNGFRSCLVKSASGINVSGSDALSPFLKAAGRHQDMAPLASAAGKSTGAFIKNAVLIVRAALIYAFNTFVIVFRGFLKAAGLVVLFVVLIFVILGVGNNAKAAPPVPDGLSFFSGEEVTDRTNLATIVPEVYVLQIDPYALPAALARDIRAGSKSAVENFAHSVLEYPVKSAVPLFSLDELSERPVSGVGLPASLGNFIIVEFAAPPTDQEAFRKKLEQTPGVISAVPDYIVHMAIPSS